MALIIARQVLAFMAAAIFCLYLTFMAPTVSVAAGVASSSSAAAHEHSRHLLQAPPPLLSADNNTIVSCNVTTAEVAADVQSLLDNICSPTARDVCCSVILSDLSNPAAITNFDLLPVFAQVCRDRLRQVDLCQLVEQEPQAFGVLQPVLDVCASLRAPCVPPPSCDTSLDTVERAVADARSNFRSCQTGGSTIRCYELAVGYECPPTGICIDGTRCSFTPSQSAIDLCCSEALGVLYTAVPCLASASCTGSPDRLASSSRPA